MDESNTCPKCSRASCSADMIRGTHITIRTCLAGHIWWDDPQDERGHAIMSGGYAGRRAEIAAKRS